MSCKYCGEEATLMPSAAHRAAQFGERERAGYYKRLLPDHTHCILDNNKRVVDELMKKHCDNPNYGDKL